MTSRHWQEEAKQKGLPWTKAKGFDTSLPVGDLIPKDRVADPAALTLWLNVNGQSKQRASTSLMLFKVPTIISEVSKIHSLSPGDLILTGTPAGVSGVRRGDKIDSGIDELGCKLSVNVH
mmetsp:Transcript_47521/g.126025  ORF Transcript_47521/g.126025 Transcript_47521/m.126025 type:complete len:120 (-) Transcript_47521:247-606(-)